MKDETLLTAFETLEDALSAGFAINTEQMAYYLLHRLNCEPTPTDENSIVYHQYKMGKAQFERMIYVLDHVCAPGDNA